MQKDDLNKKDKFQRVYERHHDHTTINLTHTYNVCIHIQYSCYNTLIWRKLSTLLVEPNSRCDISLRISVFALWNLPSVFPAMGKRQIWSKKITSQPDVQWLKAGLEQAERKRRGGHLCSNWMSFCPPLSNLKTSYLQDVVFDHWPQVQSFTIAS